MRLEKRKKHGINIRTQKKNKTEQTIPKTQRQYEVNGQRNKTNYLEKVWRGTRSEQKNNRRFLNYQVGKKERKKKYKK